MTSAQFAEIERIPEFAWGKGGTGVHSPMSGRQEGEGWGRGQRMAEMMGPGAWAQLGGAGREACVRLEEARGCEHVGEWVMS